MENWIRNDKYIDSKYLARNCLFENFVNFIESLNCTTPLQVEKQSKEKFMNTSH